MTCTLIFVNGIKLYYQQEIWEYKCFMGLPGQRDHHYMPASKARDNKKRFHLGDYQLCILTIGTQIDLETPRRRNLHQDFKKCQKCVMVVTLVQN